MTYPAGIAPWLKSNKSIQMLLLSDQCEIDFRGKSLERALPFSCLFLYCFPFPISLLQHLSMSCWGLTVDKPNSVCRMYKDICQKPPGQNGVQSTICSFFFCRLPSVLTPNPTGIRLYSPVQQELDGVPGDCAAPRKGWKTAEYNRRLKMWWLQSVSADVTF